MFISPDIRHLLRSLKLLKDGPIAAECIYFTAMSSYIYIRGRLEERLAVMMKIAMERVVDWPLPTTT